MIQKSKFLIFLTLCFLFQNSALCFQDYLTAEMRSAQIGGVLGALGVNLAYLYLGQRNFSQLPNASTKSKEFVEEVADNHGLPNDFEVKVGDGYAAGIGTIVLEGKGSLSTLDQALKEYADAQTNEELNSALEKLDEHVGALDHEFTHYKNHDARNALIVTSMVNLGLLAAYLTFEYKYLSDYLRKSSTLKKHLYLNASGLGLAIANILFTFRHKRKQEERADEGVRNDPYVLKAMAQWAQRLQQNIKDNLKNSDWFLAKKFGALLEKYPSLYLLIDPVHPPLPVREARFKERLAELENTNSNIGIPVA